MMNDKDLLKYTCLRIRELFRDTSVNVDTYYHITPQRKFNDLSIDVKLEFTIPDKNLAILDNHLSEVRKKLTELTGE